MLGRILLTVDSLGLLFGAIVFDWNETHIFNPRWPPHAKYVSSLRPVRRASMPPQAQVRQPPVRPLADARDRFHNAQTMCLSVALGVATLFYTWRPLLGGRGPDAAGRLSLRTAAFTGSIYWLAGLASAAFPGSSGLDPEFGGPGFPQAPVFATYAAMALSGWLLESS